jgi:hypothetical protein
VFFSAGVLFVTIQAQKIRLHSLLIVRNGYQIVEAYFDPSTRGVRQMVKSNTKSVIAALIGMESCNKRRTVL